VGTIKGRVKGDVHRAENDSSGSKLKTARVSVLLRAPSPSPWHLSLRRLVVWFARLLRWDAFHELIKKRHDERRVAEVRAIDHPLGDERCPNRRKRLHGDPKNFGKFPGAMRARPQLGHREKATGTRTVLPFDEERPSSPVPVPAFKPGGGSPRHFSQSTGHGAWKDHSWLVPLLDVHWSTFAPLALEAPETSRTSPLFTLVTM